MPSRMNPEIKAEWVRRLKSGDYKQTIEGYLKIEKVPGQFEYCCLGVLCEIAQDNGILYQKDTPGVAGNGIYSVFSFNEGVAYLPEAVRNWAGLHSTEGTYTLKLEHRSLIGDNDGGTSFTEIADIIEENF